MRSSELIEQLQELYDHYGDKEILYMPIGSPNCCGPEEVELHGTEPSFDIDQKKPKAFLIY